MLVEKIKMRQCRVFPFLRESIIAKDVYTEDIKDKENEKYENIQRKESEEKS